MSNEEELMQLRQKIDKLDKEIVELLSQRARIALQIGIIKGDTTVQRPEREIQVLRQVATANKGPLSDEGVQSVFSKIIEVCRTIQYNKQG